MVERARIIWARENKLDGSRSIFGANLGLLNQWIIAILWPAIFSLAVLIGLLIGFLMKLTGGGPLGFTLQERVAETVQIRKVKIHPRTGDTSQVQVDSLLGNFMPISVTIRDLTFDFELNGKIMGSLSTDLALLLPSLGYEGLQLSFQVPSAKLSDILATGARKRKANVSAAGSMTIIAHYRGGPRRPEADVHEKGTFNLRSVVPIKIVKPDQRPFYTGFLDRLYGQPGRFQP